MTEVSSGRKSQVASPPEGVDPQYCWKTDPSYWWDNYGVGLSAQIVNYAGHYYDYLGNLSDQYCYDQSITTMGRVSTDIGGGVTFVNSRVKNVTSITALLGSWCRTYTIDPETGRHIPSFDHPDVMVRAVTTNYEQIRFKVPHPDRTPVTITAPDGSYLLGAVYYFDPDNLGDAPCDGGNRTVLPYFRIETASGTDLMASKPIVTQTGSTVGSDNIQTVSPGDVQVEVPVSGSNLGAISSGTTTVTLQVGSQAPQSQVVSIAQIQSAGTYKVPFKVTFGQKEIGLQTITATIAPGNPFGETNFQNNSENVQVKVVPPYKLVAFLDGSTTPIPDAGGSQTLVPSVKACGVLKDSENGDTDVEIRCVQVGDPAYLPVAGCKFILDLSQGPDSGGHIHNANDETRPFVLDPLSPSFPVGQFLSVDSKGKGLTYTPPEVAGDVFLQIAGTDPNGNQIAGPSYLFHIQDTDLGMMVSLNGAGAGQGPGGSNPGISVVTASREMAKSCGFEV